jgi:hypothetical protein
LFERVFNITKINFRRKNKELKKTRISQRENIFHPRKRISRPRLSSRKSNFGIFMFFKGLIVEKLEFYLIRIKR